MKKLLSAFCICLTLLLHAQSEKTPIQVTDMLKIKQISQLKISPDGKDLLLMVNSILPEGDRKWEYKYLNQIYLMPLDGSAKPRPLTTQENASQPAWSPDGNHIVFVRLVNTKPQLFSLSLDGGEPIQLTRFRYGASAPKWSPDGKQLLFSASITLKELLTDSLLNPGREIPKWPFEKPGFPDNGQFREKTATPDPDGNLDEIRAYLANNERDKKAKVIDKLNFQEESTTSSEISFTHFFIMDIKPNSTPRELTHGFYRYQSADFTPDGKHLIITGNRDSLQHPDRSLESSVYRAYVDGSDWQTLLSGKGKTYQVARISPSGNWLAYQAGETDNVGIPQLGIISLTGSHRENKVFPFDRNTGNLTWTSDEKTIYFTAQNEGGAPVYRLELATKKITPITDQQAGVNSFAIDENLLLYVKTDATNPFEVYASDLNGNKEHRLSSFNYDWLQNRKLSVPEKRSFVNELGLTIDYWIMKPVNYETGKKYPAILDIHGGPTAMWGPGESSMWHEFQYYCAKGYVVVYGNPRGSGGYGTPFLRANINDWGKGPASDVLTYLDKAVAEGAIDTAKLAVTGGSYAGYLVAWIVGHDQRFKAACSQRGVYDLRTFFGEGNAWRLVPDYFGGYPWETATKEILERESPITYVNNIHTPYLIFHGESDLRTGVVGGEMMYKSLKVLGSPVEYVRHPGATHELTRSGNNRQRIDQMLRTLEFFERYIKH